MQKIHIKTGATIVELTEGAKVPLMRVVGQGGIDTRGQETEVGSGVWEFKFQGKWWTVGGEWVEKV